MGSRRVCIVAALAFACGPGGGETGSPDDGMSPAPIGDVRSGVDARGSADALSGTTADVRGGGIVDLGGPGDRGAADVSVADAGRQDVAPVDGPLALDAVAPPGPDASAPPPPGLDASAPSPPGPDGSAPPPPLGDAGPPPPPGHDGSAPPPPLGDAGPPPPPGPDASAPPLPLGDAGPPPLGPDAGAIPPGPLVVDNGSGATIGFDPTQNDAVTALAACMELVLACVRTRGAPEDACVLDAPVCQTEEPWLEMSPCCAQACFDAYSTRRAAGEEALGAMMNVFTADRACMPGVPAPRPEGAP